MVNHRGNKGCVIQSLVQSPICNQPASYEVTLDVNKARDHPVHQSILAKPHPLTSLTFSMLSYVMFLFILFSHPLHTPQFKLNESRDLLQLVYFCMPNSQNCAWPTVQALQVFVNIRVDNLGGEQGGKEAKK